VSSSHQGLDTITQSLEDEDRRGGYETARCCRGKLQGQGYCRLPEESCLQRYSPSHGNTSENTWRVPPDPIVPAPQQIQRHFLRTPTKPLSSRAILETHFLPSPISPLPWFTSATLGFCRFPRHDDSVSGLCIPGEANLFAVRTATGKFVPVEERL